MNNEVNINWENIKKLIEQKRILIIISESVFQKFKATSNFFLNIITAKSMNKETYT